MQVPPEDRTLEARAPSDPTLEAAPEEPTVSAQVDVRAAFAAQAVALPKAEAILVPEEEHPAHRQEHTLPLPSLQAPPPAPASGPSVTSDRGLAHDTVSVEDPYEIPGIGPPRRSMKGVVFAVLGFCGLLCAGATAVSLWPHPNSAEGSTIASAAASSVPAAAPVPAPSTSVTVAESTPAAPAGSAPPVVQVAPLVPAPAIAPAAAIVPVAAVEPGPAAALRAPRAAPAVAATPARPRATTTAKPTGKGSIVRDAPF